MAGANNNKPTVLPDGSFDFSGGVDSSKVTTIHSALNPNGLARNQTGWMYNCTARGGGLTQRTGWQPLVNVLSGGRWQGGYIYEPDSANPYLVFQVDGILYSQLLEAPYTLTDLTGGDVSKRNPPTAEMAFFVQGENYLIIQAGDYFTGPANILVNDYAQPLVAPSTTLPLFWDGTTLRRSRGITTAAPGGYLPNINEIPAATEMDYYQGHIWYAQARQYSAGDLVGGPSGTAANHYRDSILSVTENPLVLGGDGFTVPTNAGNIRALKHSANLNATLGEGQLFIFTRKAIYSLRVPTTRTDWIGADTNNQPVQTVVQLINGTTGGRSVVPVNGDLFYQSLEPAVRSLQISVRNFGQWANTPISQNEQRALQLNDRSLMRFSSGIEFDNRLLQLVLPKEILIQRSTPSGPSQIVVGPLFLPFATFSLPYSGQLTASGGTGPYNFSVTSGSLPTWLSMTPQGALSSALVGGDSPQFTITAVDSIGNTGTRVYQILLALP